MSSLCKANFVNISDITV